MIPCFALSIYNRTKSIQIIVYFVDFLCVQYFCSKKERREKIKKIKLEFRYNYCLLLIKVSDVVRDEKTMKSQSNSKKVSGP